MVKGMLITTVFRKMMSLKVAWERKSQNKLHCKQMDPRGGLQNVLRHKRC